MIMSLQAPRHSKSTKLNFRVSDYVSAKIN